MSGWAGGVTIRVFGLLSLVAASCAGQPVGAGGAEIPDPDLDGAAPQVQRKVARFRDGVRKAPRSAEAWGRYGMVLDAHGFMLEAVTAYGRAHEFDAKVFRWPYYRAILLSGTDSAEALALFEVALSVDPNYTPARIRAAQLLERLGRQDQAWGQYERAIAIDPGHAEAHAGLGGLALARGQADLAVEELERAIELEPNHPTALRALARAYHRTGQPERARQTAQAARRMQRRTRFVDPLHFQITTEAVSLGGYRRRVDAYIAVQRLDLALETLSEALKAIPDDPSLLMSLAKVYALEGEYERVVEMTTRALRIDATRSNAHHLAAIAQFELGRYDQADSQAADRLADVPDDIEMLRIRGLVSAGRGQTDAAIDHLTRVLAARPEETSTRLRLGQVLSSAGRVRDAVDQLTLLVAHDPDHLDAWTLLGFLRLRLNELDAAVAGFDRALAIDPDRSDAMTGLVRSLFAGGRTDDAIQRLTARVRKAPHDVSARRLLVQGCLGTGRYDDAVSHLRVLLDADSKDAGLWTQLGVGLSRSGRTEEAVSAFERSLEIAPNASVAVGGLARALVGIGRAGEAVTRLVAARRVHADDVPLANNLAWILATCVEDTVRDAERATVIAEWVIEQPGGRSAGTLDTLAAAYAESGRFAEAVDTMRAAIAEAQAAGAPAERMSAYRARLDLYRANKPQRTP